MKELTRLTTEQANNATYDLVARLTNPASYDYMPTFPGMDMLGLSPENGDDRLVADAIILAIESGQNTEGASFGRLTTMIEFKIINLEKIYHALQRIYSSKNDRNLNIE